MDTLESDEKVTMDPVNYFVHSITNNLQRSHGLYRQVDLGGSAFLW
jgi:hypothetical protein